MLDKLDERVQQIVDLDIRDFTSKVVHGIPVAAWKLPSGKYHHYIDERGIWGVAIHSLRVDSVSTILADCYNLPQTSKDLLRSAALLHDIGKHGEKCELVYIPKDHPYLVRKMIKALHLTSTYLPEILKIVEAHMGKWSIIPVDIESNKLIAMLHLADCLEARWPEEVVKEK